MEPPTQFKFPGTHHLLITTSSQIYAWSSTGICTVFRSNKNGIVAATEAQDESGVLAIAAKHAVVLHDTKRGQERSWGLQADGDEVRYLAYSSDAKSLFLSTSLTADIQRYSMEHSRLLPPSRAHASPPVALAVSATGHVMVSASEDPPVVYLKSLQHNSSPLLVEPRASKAAACVAAFHPERPNIFLLAFRDGAAAAYDTTRIMRTAHRMGGNQEAVNNAEISHLRTLHRAGPMGSNMHAVTGAAFLRGFKTRAVTTGSDGRCRIIDFGEGGVVLRTWHAKAPVTSVSALSLKHKLEPRKQSAGNSAPHTIGGPTSTDNLIAIGRADGEVHIYSSVGLLLSQYNPGEHEGKIINVQWIKGPSPSPLKIPSVHKVAKVSPSTSRLPREQGQEQSWSDGKGPRNQMDIHHKRRRQTMFEHLGLPPELRKPKVRAAKPGEIGPTRKLTVHPDEIEAGTVRHMPNVQSLKPVPIENGDYLDLFSPPKASKDKHVVHSEKRLVSPPRSRPAITSQTFIKSPEPTAHDQYGSTTRQRNLALFPSTNSASETSQTTPIVGRKDASSTVAKRHIQEQRRRKNSKTGFNHRSGRRGVCLTYADQLCSNPEMLSSLRKSATQPAAPPLLGALSNLTCYPEAGKTDTKNSARNLSAQKLRPFRRSTDHVETHLGSDEARAAYDHAHKGRHWPEDSVQDASLKGDVWLTSDSEGGKRPPAMGNQSRDTRPPARQTSRSRVNSKGTFSTLAVQLADPASASAQRLKMDGSTEEEMFTADTHATSNGTFSPSSKEVRELFPRTSSLSPCKHHKQKKRRRSPKPDSRKLQEIAPNTIANRPPKSPWERARASKAAQRRLHEPIKHRDGRVVEVYGDPACVVDTKENGHHCAICGPTSARVQELEAEVARLKRDILACKAALKRQGTFT